MAEPIQTTPFTIITGFLGAGKTTVLNQFLNTDHGQRLAVIVNEFGAVNIDSQLIARRLSNGLVEMTNGCVCCTVQQDLKDGLHALLEQRRNGHLAFEHVVLETTGMAKTGPIIQTLASKDLKCDLHLHAVITVVDAVHGPAQFDEFDEAQEQVGMADIIILNKTDLTTEDGVQALTTRIVKMNAIARVTPCQHGQVDVEKLLGKKSAPSTHPTPRLSRDNGTDDHSHGKHDHSHSDHVTTFAIQISEPLDHGLVQDWLSYLVMRHTEQMLRYKGVLNIAGRNSRVIVQGIHAIVNVTSDRDWQADETRKTEFVFIGKNLPEQDIRKDLDRCVAVTQNQGF